jgi:hypothetical protein
MAQKEVVTMLMLHLGTRRDQEGRKELADALAGADVSEPDDAGVFDISLQSGDREDALRRVWDGVAASGTDDHIAFLEHPELAEHWRQFSRRPDR